jgi:phosphoribosylformylglycinamidine synthase
MLAHPNIGSKRAVWQRYDHMIGTNTVAAPGADAAVLRLKGRCDGIALSVDGNGRLCWLDPYLGGALAIAEGARNLACVGARPLCATDGLNFGNPEKPGVAYQLQQAIRGMADACRALEIPIVSGNVSLYNESQTGPIYPTPIVGMAGQIDDLAHLCTPGFKAADDAVFLLGGAAVSLGGSAYACMRTGTLSGTPAPLDLDLERRVQACVRDAIARDILRSAHDCSDGGLAVALAECSLVGDLGAYIDPEDPKRIEDLAEMLFGEGPARIVISVAPEGAPALMALAREYDVALRRLGQVHDDSLVWRGVFAIGLGELRAAWNSALDALTHA